MNSETGFKFTMNVGQVLQMAGFIGPLLFFYYKVFIKHALRENDINHKLLNINTQLREHSEIIDRLDNTVRQLPQIIINQGRSEERHRALLEKIVDSRKNFTRSELEDMLRMARDNEDSL